VHTTIVLMGLTFLICYFLEKKLYLKSLHSGNVVSWGSVDIPKENSTADRGLIINKIELFNVATKNDINCELVINPGKYLEDYSFTSFAYQKDFALKKMLDYHLHKFKQGCVKRLIMLVLSLFYN
jgi:hypothetical protein